MIIVGVLLIIIGITLRPLIQEFWEPGLLGASVPKGWRGCMSLLVTPFVILELLLGYVLKMSSYILWIGGGLLLLVFNLTSRMALPFPLVLLSMGITSGIIFVEWIRVSRARFCVTLRNALLDGVPVCLRYLQGIRDTTHTIVTLRNEDYSKGTVVALQWIPPSTNGGLERLALAKANRMIIWKAGEAARTNLLKNSKIHPIDSGDFTYNRATDVAISPDGLYTAFSDRSGFISIHRNNAPKETLGALNIVNIAQDQATLTSRLETGVLADWLRREDQSSSVTAIAWAPSLPYRLAFGSTDHTVKVWYFGKTLDESQETHSLRPYPPAYQRQMQIYREHQNIVTDVAWSPDGKSIASTSADATVHIWNAETGQTTRIYRNHTGVVYALSWAPDGSQIATASADESVQVWNASTGEKMIAYRGHHGEVLAVTWSPDGKWIASAGQDKTVQVWEAATGQIRMTYWMHRKTVLAIGWSSDGQYIASGGKDGTVRLWQMGSTPLTGEKDTC